jgi:predicted DNA-binding transcriptional regulator YafY
MKPAPWSPPCAWRSRGSMRPLLRRPKAPCRRCWPCYRQALAPPPTGPDDATRARLETLRIAAEGRRKVFLHYRDLQDATSQRSVRPLGCFYWSTVWTLAAWCEVREDFRSFRVDRIERLDLLDERFRDEPGKSLPDLFRREEQQRP